MLVVDGFTSVGLEPRSDLQPAVCPFADVPDGHGVEIADGGAGAVDATLLFEGLAPGVDLFKLPEQVEVVVEDYVGGFVSGPGPTPVALQDAAGLRGVG
ncbi:hypothetical protein [Streptomyces sp. NPDC003032]